jgi:hypothetical protein
MVALAAAQKPNNKAIHAKHAIGRFEMEAFLARAG